MVPSWLFFLVLAWLLLEMQIPDFNKLLYLPLRENTTPPNLTERWAMEWYRATFAPDCGISWFHPVLSWLGWISWLSMFVLAVLTSLFARGLLPDVPGLVFWVTALVVVSTTLFAHSTRDRSIVTASEKGSPGRSYPSEPMVAASPGS
ncbi:hypothetical protein ACJU26_09675 [Acidithiobacillus sp. M4-SHS-6]|uniref:hypothetical protein n=1 Tax=Acidithiobacillus sp. M4-SHS-6 TaxID=3383024 RepID=UPI0039BDF6D6